MNGRDMDGLLARRLADEDVAHDEPQISCQPIQPACHPDGDMKIGKSLRVPMSIFEQMNAIAERRRMPWSALVRQWIAEGLARDAEAEIDPLVELRHHLDAANRALRAMERQRDAA
jgi:hypothetical protein